MGLNTEFSLVTDLNKGCSSLMVLKLNVWRRICSAVRLNTDILIGTSVWDLEGAKNQYSISPFHTCFGSCIIGYTKNSDFENGMKF